MKVTIERDVLAEAATWTARIIPNRPNVPVLAGILLDANADTLTLSAFDYETSARTAVAAEVGDPGRVLVSGKLLASIVKALPAKPVDLTLDGSKVRLTCGSAKFTLLTMPESEYPSLPGMPEASGTIPGDVFAQAVGQVAVAASRDETLPILTAVRVEFEADQVTMTATDRYRLAERTFKWVPTTGSPVLPALVRSRTLQDVAKTTTAGTDVTLGVGGSHAGFEACTRCTTTLLVDGDYPKVGALFPAPSSSHAVVETAALQDAIRRVALVAERNTPVQLTFDADQVTLAAGQGEDAQASETVDATCSGDEPFVQRYNPQFLLDGLGALGAAYARLNFTEPRKPAVITGQAEAGSELDESYRYLIMPVRQS